MEKKAESGYVTHYLFALAILVFSQAVIYQYVLGPKLKQETLFEMEPADYLHKQLGFMYSDWGADWSFLEQRGIDNGQVQSLPASIPDSQFTTLFVDPTISHKTVLYIAETFREAVRTARSEIEAAAFMVRKFSGLRCPPNDDVCASQVRILSQARVEVETLPWGRCLVNPIRQDNIVMLRAGQYSLYLFTEF